MWELQSQSLAEELRNSLYPTVSDCNLPASALDARENPKAEPLPTISARSKRNVPRAHAAARTPSKPMPSIPPMPIRPARTDEIDALVAAYQWLFAPPGSQPGMWDAEKAAERLAQAIDADDATVLVGDDGDSITGICTVYDDIDSVRFGSRAWLEDLAVDPARRSEGIGKALLDAAKEWARERGATHLELDSALTRHDAHRFYDREQPSWKSMSFGWEL